MESFIAIAILSVVGYMVGSVKIINQGYVGLVERLGRYERTLNPGLNFVLPVLDTVLVETTREQLLDIEPQSTFTHDNVPVSVDAILSWRILDVRKAYYGVENLEESLKSLVVPTLRAEIGKRDLQDINSAQTQINQSLLKVLDSATEPWGVKVIRVEIQEIKLSLEMEKSLETERAAKAEKRVTLSKTEAMVESIERISAALKTDKVQAETILRYMLAQRYVDSNVELGKSDNSKIIFMDPKALSEAIGELIGGDSSATLETNGKGHE